MGREPWAAAAAAAAAAGELDVEGAARWLITCGEGRAPSGWAIGGGGAHRRAGGHRAEERRARRPRWRKLAHTRAGFKASWATCAHLPAQRRPSGLGASRGGHKAMHEVIVRWSSAYYGGRWRNVVVPRARRTAQSKPRAHQELAASQVGLWQKGPHFFAFAL